MQGRADVLAAVGRRSEAADTLDRLAADPRARGPPGRRLRRRPAGARARRVARPATAGREPRRPAPDGARRATPRPPRRSSARSSVLDSVPGVDALRTGRRPARPTRPATPPRRRPAAARSGAADPRRRGGARGRRSRRGPPARARRGHRPPRGRPVPRRDGCLLPGARDPAVRPGHPPAPRRAVPRPRLARPGRRQARPARPAVAAHRRRRRPAAGCATSRRPASRTTPGWRPSAPDVRSRGARAPPRVPEAAPGAMLHSGAMSLLGSIFEQVRLTTIVDIGITALLIYWLFSLIRGTRAVRLVIGVSVLVLVYALAVAFDLRLLTQILQAGRRRRPVRPRRHLPAGAAARARADRPGRLVRLAPVAGRVARRRAMSRPRSRGPPPACRPTARAP